MLKAKSIILFNCVNNFKVKFCSFCVEFTYQLFVEKIHQLCLIVRFESSHMMATNREINQQPKLQEEKQHQIC